jgi:DNA-binding SARP family transcriptional activator
MIKESQDNPVDVTRFRVHTFGGFELQDARATAATNGPATGRPMELLKALVAAGGERVKLHFLADQLWPRYDSDYAHRSLTTTLHRLRKLLTVHGALLVRGGELSLDRRCFWCDTWAFDSARARAMAAAQAAGDTHNLVAIGHELLTLYRGPLLATDNEAPWSAAPREQRRQQFLRVLTTLGNALDRQSRPEAAAELYCQALEAEPHSEPLYRRLMLALQRSGRGAEAIEVFHTCRTLLRSQLLSAPSAATIDLYRTLVPLARATVSET